MMSSAHLNGLELAQIKWYIIQSCNVACYRYDWSFATLTVNFSPHARRISLNRAINLAQNPRANKEQLLTVFLYLATDSIKNLILVQAWSQANQGETGRSIGFMTKHNFWDSAEARLVASFVALKKTCLSTAAPAPSMPLALSLFTIDHTCYV